MTSLKCSAYQHKVAVATVDAESVLAAVPSQDKVEVTKSPLYISLLSCALSHGAFTTDACSYESIPEENNPRPLQQQMGDKAEYWVNRVGEFLHMKFMARLDYHGQYSHLGPYFNLFDSGIDVSNLKQTRAQFELHFLTLEDDTSSDYPQEALDMSCRVLSTLSALTMAVEDRHNAGVPEAEHPASELLFKDLPKEGSMTTPRISRQDIGKSGVLLSPSKAKQLAQASAAARSSHAANTSASGEFLHIRNLHDLDNCYSGLGSLKETKVECPDVHDGNGLLIHPEGVQHEVGPCAIRQSQGLPEIVRWNINKSDKDDASKCERLGSQNYQLIMHQMQLLPSMGYAKADVLKGKRKASEELASSLQAKKLAVVTGEDDSMDEL
ncbi:hypothetical protein F4604DRAFT_1925654 [Suillus subluteus]|nr:hypothetical protein F4604DRAFT_1925654 [Suillus subluteus]